MIPLNQRFRFQWQTDETNNKATLYHGAMQILELKYEENEFGSEGAYITSGMFKLTYQDAPLWSVLLRCEADVVEQFSKAGFMSDQPYHQLVKHAGDLADKFTAFKSGIERVFDEHFQKPKAAVTINEADAHKEQFHG